MLITVDSSKNAKVVRGKDDRGSEITSILVKISLLLKYIDKCLAPTTKEQLLVNAATPYTCTKCNKQASSKVRTTLYNILGTLRSDDSDGDGNATKAIGLISKTTILHVYHAFLYISLPSLHDYDVKMPNFPMYRGST